MNFKGFKKVAEDKNFTTLRHYEGHELKIAHGKLSKEHRNAIKALPNKGPHVTKEEKAAAATPASAVQAPILSQGSPKDQALAPGPMMADGGEVAESNASKMKRLDNLAEKYMRELRPQPDPTPSPSPSPTPGYAQGGEVDEMSKRRQPAPTPSPDTLGGKIGYPKAYADGGQVPPDKQTLGDKIGYPKAYAAGGAVDPQGDGEAPMVLQDGTVIPPASQMPPAQGGEDPNAFAKAGHYVGGVLRQGVTDATDTFKNVIGGALNPVLSAAKGVAEGVSGVPAGSIDSAGQPNSTEMPPQAPQMPQDQQSPAPKGGSSQGDAKAPPSLYQQGIEDYKKGLQGEANAQSLQGRNSVAAMEAGNKALAAQRSVFDENANKLNSHIEEAKQAMADQHFDPQRVLSNQNVFGKISTAIGLILGGYGGGLQGRANPAQEYLTKMMDNDIQTQRMEMDKKENILGASFKQFGNMRDAADFTRVMQNQMIQNEMQKAAARAQGPMAQAAMQKQMGQMQMDQGVLMAKLNARQVLEHPQASGVDQDRALSTLRMLDPAQAKEYEGRLVPGIGTARIPVPEKQREGLVRHANMTNLLDQAIQQQQQYGATGAWSVKNRADAHVLKDQLQVSLNDLYGLGRLNENEYKNYASQIGNIGGLNMGGTMEQLMKLKELNASRDSQLRRAYGLPQTQPIPESPRRR